MSTTRDERKGPGPAGHLGRVVGQAVAIATTGALLGVGANALRSSPLPLVAREEIETLVPCPEPVGDATAITGSDARIRGGGALLVDARSPEEFSAWHPEDAVSFPFDWLAESEEVKEQAGAVAKEIARSGKRHVVVYGDGADPDCGQHWAALLAGAGIKNVVFVSGGAASLGQPSPVTAASAASAAPAGGAE